VCEVFGSCVLRLYSYNKKLSSFLHNKREREAQLKERLREKENEKQNEKYAMVHTRKIDRETERERERERIFSAYFSLQEHLLSILEVQGIFPHIRHC
jgi:hypothetical protein